MRLLVVFSFVVVFSVSLPLDVVERLLNGNSAQRFNSPEGSLWTETMRQMFGNSANMEARRTRLQRLSNWSKMNTTDAQKNQIRLNLMQMEELPTSGSSGILEINEAEGIAEYLLQGDIQLTEEQLSQLEKDAQVAASGRRKRQASTTFKKWTGNALYYYFDSSLPMASKTAVNQAVAYFQANTCVNFAQNSGVANRVKIMAGTGCSSFVGMIGGEQILYLTNGCAYTDKAGHELMHALGVFHIQNRPDRDNFVTINTAAVSPSLVSNYEKVSAIVNYVPYEYGSVMHYQATAFQSGNGGLPMVAKDSRYMNTMGSPIISFYDLKIINDHYGCAASCPSTSSAQCKNGGFPNPRRCSTCICPSGYGGTLCDQRPSGCGETLTASSTWQTKSFTVSDRSSSQPEYNMCNHWIIAPAGQKIQVKVTQMSDSSCTYGCILSAIEPKLTSDQKLTNPRLCCKSALNQEFTSTLNPTPIFSYSRYPSAVTYTIQYKTVEGTVNPEPSECKDTSSNCPTWASNGFCSNTFYPLETRKGTCGKTCNLCGGTATCTDSSTSCSAWIRNADFCSSTFYTLDQKKQYCGASCNLC